MIQQTAAVLAISVSLPALAAASTENWDTAMNWTEARICAHVQRCEGAGVCEEAAGQILVVSTTAPPKFKAEHGLVVWASIADAPGEMERIDHSPDDGMAFDADGHLVTTDFERGADGKRTARVLVPIKEQIDGRITARLYEKYSSRLSYHYYDLVCEGWSPR